MNFFRNFDFKIGCKNAFDIINRKYAADSEINFLTESIFKPFGLKSLVRQRGSQKSSIFNVKILKKSRADLWKL